MSQGLLFIVCRVTRASPEPVEPETIWRAMTRGGKHQQRSSEDAAALTWPEKVSDGILGAFFKHSFITQLKVVAMFNISKFGGAYNEHNGESPRLDISHKRSPGGS